MLSAQGAKAKNTLRKAVCQLNFWGSHEKGWVDWLSHTLLKDQSYLQQLCEIAWEALVHETFLPSLLKASSWQPTGDPISGDSGSSSQEAL